MMNGDCFYLEKNAGNAGTCKDVKTQRFQWQKIREDQQQPSFGGSVVKNLPAKQETQVPSLGQEEPPGEGNGYPLQYSFLGIPWTEEPGGL